MDNNMTGITDTTDTTTVTTTSQSAAKKRLTVFLVVTFVLTWGLDVIACTMLGAFENGESATPAIAIPIAISMFFPLVGALVANRACKPEERIDLVLRPRIKSNVRYYLAAWFAPSIVTLIGCIIFFVANPQLFDPTLSYYSNSMKDLMEAAGGSSIGNMPTDQELADLIPILIVETIALAIVIAPFINMIPAFGEEVGWRSMLFPTLCELMPARAAVIVSGIIWGIWHAPIIAIGHNYGMDYPGFPWAGILVMILACTALGSCLCYLRMRSQTIWPCALAHGAVNAVANIGVPFCIVGQTLAGPSPLGYIAGIPVLILGIVCWLKIERQHP